jgi:hypothetical protein
MRCESAAYTTKFLPHPHGATSRIAAESSRLREQA